jgi:hypothetical protein
VPPEALYVTGPYATPTMPLASEEGPVTVREGRLMVNDSELCAVLLAESFTVHTTV